MVAVEGSSEIEAETHGLDCCQKEQCRANSLLDEVSVLYYKLHRLILLKHLIPDSNGIMPC